MTEREAVARIIDPSSWRVMDSYLAAVKRKHPYGGYDPDSFKDNASLTKADAILARQEGERDGWIKAAVAQQKRANSAEAEIGRLRAAMEGIEPYLDQAKGEE